MKKRRIASLVVPIVLIFSFQSCSNKIKPYPDGFVIEIKPEVLEYSEFVEHVKEIRLVPLETRPEAIIGYIYTFDIYKNRIYAADIWSTKSVYIYDLNGRWVNTICSLGKGPSEYTRISDVAFDPFNEELVVLADSKNILKYDADGKFLSQLRLDFSAMNIGIVDSDTYSFKIPDEERRPAVVSYKKNSNNTITLYTGVQELNMGSGSNFPRFNGTQLFLDYMNDTVYKIGRETAEPYHYLDFMNLKVTEADKEVIIGDVRAKRRFPNVPKNKAGDVFYYNEIDNYINLGFRYQDRVSYLYIDKRSNAQYLIQRKNIKVLPLDELFFSDGKIEETGEFVCVLHTDKYLDLLENDIFKSLQNQGKVKIETKGFENQADVTLESNQVIAIIQLY